MADGAFPHFLVAMQTGYGPDVCFRHQSYVLSRNSLFAPRSRMAGMAVLRLYQYEPDQQYLARRSFFLRLYHPLPEFPANG